MLAAQDMAPQPGAARWGRADWLALALILFVAMAVRLALFTGLFGSDETYYSTQAMSIVAGDWQLSDYIGDLRLGQNGPMAFFVWLFGPSIAALNTWPFLCSLGEIALVYYIGREAWGMRAAVLSSLFLAFLPVHIHYAGRLMADPPLAFFITSSFVLFFLGERRNSAPWYFAAGIAAGYVFWIKEVVVIFGAVFALYALATWTWKPRRVWFVAGAVVVLAANLVTFWVLADDPLYIFKVIARTVERNYIDNPASYVNTSPRYYFSLMLTDLRDAWIMPYAALGALTIAAVQLVRKRKLNAPLSYILVWAAGLVAVFSFAVISVRPVMFIAKQANYMMIFTAPLCLLAGYGAMRLRGAALTAVMIVYISGGIVLAALEEQSVRVFTANSKAALAFARAYNDAPVYGMVNAARIAAMVAKMEGKPVALVHEIRDLVPANANARGRDANATGTPAFVYAIVDPQTSVMGRNGVTTPADVPLCWGKPRRLERAGLGSIGEAVLALRIQPDDLPKFLNVWLNRYIAHPLRPPQSAYVFTVPVVMEGSPPGPRSACGFAPLA